MRSTALVWMKNAARGPWALEIDSGINLNTFEVTLLFY